MDPQRVIFVDWQHALVDVLQQGFAQLASTLRLEGTRMATSLDAITTALNTLSATLDTELLDIADALRNNPTPEEIAAVVTKVDDLRTRIENIIP